MRSGLRLQGWKRGSVTTEAPTQCLPFSIFIFAARRPKAPIVAAHLNNRAHDAATADNAARNAIVRQSAAAGLGGSDLG